MKGYNHEQNSVHNTSQQNYSILHQIFFSESILQLSKRFSEQQRPASVVHFIFYYNLFISARYPLVGQRMSVFQQPEASTVFWRKKLDTVTGVPILMPLTHNSTITLYLFIYLSIKQHLRIPGVHIKEGEQVTL